MRRPHIERPAALTVEAATFSFHGPASSQGERPVAVETAVNIVYGTVPYAVMMATPADLEDFVIGFSLTEGVVGARSDIRAVRVEAASGGLLVTVDLVPGRFHSVLARRRSMAGRTGCGVCGIEELAGLPGAGSARAKRVEYGGTVRLDAIARALGELESHQVLNAATHAVHAAAWAGSDGAVVCVREDVGRHNALDKLVGALLTQGIDPAEGFVLITSRCSFEMVEKAAAFGARTLVAISAPTSLGIERARAYGMTLVGVARRDAVTAFTGAERIVVGADAPERSRGLSAAVQG